MPSPEIIQAVNRALAQEFELADSRLVPEANLYEDLGLDSLDAVDMVVVMEQTFKIKIRSNFDPMRFQTLGDLHAFVEEVTREARETGQSA